VLNTKNSPDEQSPLWKVKLTVIQQIYHAYNEGRPIQADWEIVCMEHNFLPLLL